jgi:hypothetical protein
MLTNQAGTKNRWDLQGGLPSGLPADKETNVTSEPRSHMGRAVRKHRP